MRLMQHLLSTVVVGLFVFLAFGSSPPPSSSPSSSPTPASTPTPSVPKPTVLETLSSAKEALDNFAAHRDFVSKDQVLVALEGLHGIWVAIQDGSQSADDAVSKTAKALSAQMSRAQTAQFPKLRRAWIKAVAAALWENDVKVTCVNQSCTTVQFVGGLFAANANKKKVNDELSPVMRQLRIKQARFKWIDSASEYTYWDYDSPKDSEVTSILR